ncbi:BTB domain-containing protein [Mycena venus]|uniref:BTB domain-containing protein n=1 Tax=Mycena venus TaxID=2733690 RepID=A0A8H6Y8C7_9AGAR|nr:BTB domain-containing protein [Mycena venus]
MSDSPATIVDTSPPFSGVVDANELDPQPDLILRSEDSVDFHVHKIIRRLAAPHCFDTMFTIPNSGDIVRDGKTVILLTEPKEVLQALLSLAYPRQCCPLYLPPKLWVESSISIRRLINISSPAYSGCSRRCWNTLWC